MLYCVGHFVMLCTLIVVLCQKQISRARTSNYIPQILWDVITCPSPYYLLLAQHSLMMKYITWNIHTFALCCVVLLLGTEQLWVKQPWKVWVNEPHKSKRAANINTAKHGVYFMGYDIYWSCNIVLYRKFRDAVYIDSCIVPEADIKGNEYTPQILCDVITCPCPWYPLLAHESSILFSSRGLEYLSRINYIRELLYSTPYWSFNIPFTMIVYV